MGDWWCHSVAQLIPTAAGSGSTAQQAPEEQIISLQCLQPPLRWTYYNRVLQDQEFHGGSLVNMFAPPAVRRKAPSSSVSQEQTGSNYDIGDADLDLFHWVQPGVLAFVAVLSSGTAAVGWATLGLQGQLRWSLTPCLPLLPTSAHVRLQAADATLSANGIVVALATQQEQGKVVVVELMGNPLFHQGLSATRRSQQPPLQALHVAACALPTAPCSAISLSWDPSSHGQALVVSSTQELGQTSSSSSRGRQQGPPGYLTRLELSQAAQAHGAPEATVLEVKAAVRVDAVPKAGQQYAWLLDGLLAGEVLRHATTLQQLPVSLPQPAAATGHSSSTSSTAHPHMLLQAVAASPHRVCAALVVLDSAASSSSSSSSSPSSRLLLCSIPPISVAAAGGAAAPACAGRLLWALLLQQHSWDVVQHLQHTARPQQQQQSTAAEGASVSQLPPAACGQVQCERVAQALLLVDRKLCAQPQDLFAVYSTRWDVLKYAVVACTPGPEAAALSIDIRLRLLVTVLEVHMAAAAKETEDPRQATPQQQQQQSRVQQGGSSTAAMAEYLGDVLDFVMSCVTTWLHRRVAAEAAAASGSPDAPAAAAAVRAVPCIRHMLDFRTSAKLMAVYQRDVGKGAQPGRPCWALWKRVNKHLDASAEQPANWEDMVLEVVPGPLQLHPQHQPSQFPHCLPNFRLPAERLLHHLKEAPDCQAVPLLSDADISTIATRLGLLPAKTLAAKEHYRRCQQTHVGFRLELPGQRSTPLVAAAAAAAPTGAAVAASGDAAGVQAPRTPTKRSGSEVSASAKRMRWQQEMQEVMGWPYGPGVVRSEQLIDFVQLAWGSPAELCLESADGAVLARQVVSAESAQAGAEPKGQRKPAPHVASNWVLACPLTGEVWMPFAA